MDVDPSGNVYVVGVVAGILRDCGDIVTEVPEYYEAFLNKYGPDGDCLWSQRIGTWPGTQAWAVVVDMDGVYVAGATNETLPGQTPTGETDAFLIRYDGNGGVVWARQFGSGYAGATAITADASGVYAAGWGWGGSFVRKYDSDGNEVWTRQFGIGGAGSIASAIAAADSGVYVAGATNVALAPGPNPYHDVFTRRYDRDGNEIWTRQFGSQQEDDDASAVVADASGVYVAGWTWGILPGETDPSGGANAFIRRYDTDGNDMWIHQFGPVDFPNEALAIDASSSGVFVAGFTDGALPGQVHFGPWGGQDAFIRMYDPEGAEVWTEQLGTSGHDSATGIALGGSALYVVGFASDNAFLAKLLPANASPTLTEIIYTPAAALSLHDVMLAAVTSDLDGDVLTYTWDFGDGASVVGTTAPGGGMITATHSYATAGTYIVTLSVEDGRRRVTTESTTVRVGSPLDVEVSVEPIAGTLPLTVSFSASASGGVPPYSFEWSFGDGSSSTEQVLTHHYGDVGTYDVTVTATDATGQAATKSIQIVVPGPPPPPEISPWVLYGIPTAIALGLGAVLIIRRRAQKGSPPR